MNQVCDLHSHSVFSDGTFTPAQLVEEAERIGLSALALTDHNTVAGLPQLLEAARGTGIEAVPGIEFSTDYRGVDLHIVGLYIKPEHYARVTDLMEESQRRKEASNVNLCRALNEAGYVLDYPAIRDATPNGQVNRAHIAAAMVEKGYVESRKEAFDTLLDPKNGYYKPARRPSSFEIIRFIKSIGAVAVMAHPFLKLKEAELREFLDQACPCGLDAMETNYVTFDEETTRTAVRIAEEYHLLQSGGSDFHGANKPGISLGIGCGNLAVPLEFLEMLKTRRRL